MVQSVRRLLVVSALSVLALSGCSDDDSDRTGGSDPAVPAGSNVVLRWNGAILQAIRDAKPGPPQTARSLAIVHTAIYDAWAAYDEVAVGTRYGSDLRRPEHEMTLGRKSQAISFAAFRALSEMYPTEVARFRTLMTTLGYDPDDATLDATSPAGIGNKAAAAVLAYRRVDGANQSGELSGGLPFSDYTGYAPVNDPIRVDTPTPLDGIDYPEHWSPLTWVNQAGATVTPDFICPHWGRVIPFAMTSPSMFRPGPPAAVGSAEYADQCDELIQMSASLNDTSKVIAEYWADGPNSELPPGHFNLFAQLVSQRDDHSLDDDVKMFFALTNAVFDAGIAVWDAKAFYDYCRPITAIRYLYNGQTINAWGGPGQGTRPIAGEIWKPYQPSWFATPPFAEYTSGHSAFSSSAAEILKRFTGSDAFEFSYSYAQGSTKAEPGFAPTQAITLTLHSFSEAADEAAISRRYGGIHFRQGDLRSRTMGRQCAALAWEKARSFWTGQATPFRAPGEVASID